MIAVILAGRHAELGREDGALSPKILAPTAGKPLLERQLAWLKDNGISAAVLCLGVGADAVRAKFGDGADFGVSLRYLVEDAPLGGTRRIGRRGRRCSLDHVALLCRLTVGLPVRRVYQRGGPSEGTDRSEGGRSEPRPGW